MVDVQNIVNEATVADCEFEADVSDINLEPSELEDTDLEEEVNDWDEKDGTSTQYLVGCTPSAVSKYTDHVKK